MICFVYFEKINKYIFAVVNAFGVTLNFHRLVNNDTQQCSSAKINDQQALSICSKTIRNKSWRVRQSRLVGSVFSRYRVALCLRTRQFEKSAMKTWNKTKKLHVF
jgi:hypothetical protein